MSITSNCNITSRCSLKTCGIVRLQVSGDQIILSTQQLLLNPSKTTCEANSSIAHSNALSSAESRYAYVLT